MGSRVGLWWYGMCKLNTSATGVAIKHGHYGCHYHTVWKIHVRHTVSQWRIPASIWANGRLPSHPQTAHSYLTPMPCEPLCFLGGVRAWVSRAQYKYTTLYTEGTMGMRRLWWQAFGGSCRVLLMHPTPISVAQKQETYGVNPSGYLYHSCSTVFSSVWTSKI